MALRLLQSITSSCAWDPVGFPVVGSGVQDQMGFATDMSNDGNTFVVGAPYTGEDSSGLVQVYSMMNSTTTTNTFEKLGGNLVGAQPIETFGFSVGISGSGSTIVSAGFDDNGSDHVRVYTLSEDATWIPLGNEIPVRLAYAMRLSDDGRTVVVGGPEELGGDGIDSVLVFSYQDEIGDWVQKGNAMVTLAVGDFFGYAVDISGDGNIVAVGATLSEARFPRGGQVRIFRYVESTDSWMQMGNSINGDRAGRRLGFAISISNDGHWVAIGTTGNEGKGAAYVYQFNASTDMWEQKGSVLGGHDFSGFGYSVALAGDASTLAVGSPVFRTNEQSIGKVDVFGYDAASDQWIQHPTNIVGREDGDLTGAAVSLSYDGKRLVVGSTGRSTNGPRSGDVLVFENSGDCLQLEEEEHILQWWGISSIVVGLLMLLLVCGYGCHIRKRREWWNQKPFVLPDNAVVPAIDIFISHYGKDTKETFVRPMFYLLKKLGRTVFFDAHMGEGSKSYDEIAKGLYGCRIGFVVISEHFLESKWCRWELKTLYDIMESQSNNQGKLLILCYQDERLFRKVEYKKLRNYVSIIRTDRISDRQHLSKEIVPRLLARLDGGERSDYSGKEFEEWLDRRLEEVMITHRDIIYHTGMRRDDVREIEVEQISYDTAQQTASNSSQDALCNDDAAAYDDDDHSHHSI